MPNQSPNESINAPAVEEDDEEMRLCKAALYCPFCGASGLDLKIACHTLINHYVVCTKCNASGPDDNTTMALAASSWNTRVMRMREQKTPPPAASVTDKFNAS